MKKLLALVLTLVMTMALVVTSNAAFTDAADIEHTEAVEVLNALNVINGKDNNAFDPKGTVTRAEMAKMITVIMLGDVDVTAFKGTVTDLTDATGWAEAYIKYCYSQGIIAGKGNNLFDGNANVTAAEAAKMLLVALGYSAEVQGYEGAMWKINTIRDAQLSDFFDDLSVAADKTLTRDEAAQMIYNAVGANTIRQQKSQNLETGNITVSYIADATPLLQKTFSTSEYVGVMDTITYASANKEYSYDGSADFKNRIDASDINGGAAFVTTTDYTGLEGEEVSVIQKTEKNGDKTVLGIYATGKSKVEKSNVSALTTSGSKLKVNGTTYELENGLTTALADANSYNTIKLVDSDANGKLDTAVLTTVIPAKVSYVSSTEIIAGGTTYKFASNEIASNLAKNDYVTIVKKLNGVYVIEKVDAEEGRVTGDKANDNLVEINNVWYNDENKELTLGTTYKFYAVNGVVYDATAVSGTSINNLVMVLDHESNNLVNQALIMDTTGLKKTVVIDGAGDAVDPASLVDGNLYTFEESDVGYKFTAAATIGTSYTWTAGGDGTVTAADGKISGINTTGIADTAVIFVLTNDGGKVITGKQLKNLSDSLLDASASGNTAATTADGKISDWSFGSYTSTTNGLARITYAGIYFDGNTADLGVTSGNELYGYVTTKSYEVKLGNTTYETYTLWNGSENVTVFEKGTTDRAKGNLLKYDTIDAEGVISGVEAQTVTNTVSGDVTNVTEVASIRGIEGDYIYLDGTDAGNRAKLTSDTKYLYIDSNASSASAIGVASGEVVLASKYGAANYWMDNVIAIVNSSDEVVLLVVDVKNNMTNSNNGATATSTVTGATVSLSKTSGIKAGDAIAITFTGTAGFTGTVTTAWAVPADVNSSSFTVTIPASGSITVTVFAVGNGNNITVSGTLSQP